VAKSENKRLMGKTWGASMESHNRSSVEIRRAHAHFDTNRINRESFGVNVSGGLRAPAMISFSGRGAVREAADLAYQRVVEQSRKPVFFAEYGVPDTLDGRFELICLHAFLYLHRLKAERPKASQLCQGFFDRMFTDFDRALREMGTSDLGVGKQVKRMARAFFGRIRAYEEGLACDDSVLGSALARNLFGTVSEPAPFAMAHYVRGTVGELRRQSAEELLAGRILFEVPADRTRARPLRC
jgi:cytochrome b pre-mRNA-processing protein 3